MNNHNCTQYGTVLYVHYVQIARSVQYVQIVRYVQYVQYVRYVQIVRHVQYVQYVVCTLQYVQIVRYVPHVTLQDVPYVQYVLISHNWEVPVDSTISRSILVL